MYNKKVAVIIKTPLGVCDKRQLGWSIYRFLGTKKARQISNKKLPFVGLVNVVSVDLRLCELGRGTVNDSAV